MNFKRTSLFRYLSWAAGVAGLTAGIWFATRPEPVSVPLVKVERGLVEASVSNTRAGTVKACHRAKLAPPAGGQIAHLQVKKGERVKKGQVLLELWSDDLRAQLELSEQQLKTSTSRVDEVCTLADASQKAAVRAKELRESGFISAEGLERAEADAKAKQASCTTARSDIAQSRARIDLARAGLRRMVLRAPFDGIVADISGELGEYATPSPPGIPTPPAIDLIDDSCLFVSAPIDEVDAAQVKRGQEVRITLDAVKGKTFAGKVKRIAPYVIDLEKQARTVEVEVDFAEPRKEGGEGDGAAALLVGFSADVEIVHTVRDKVLRIPTQALLEGKRVLVYRNGVLEEQPVKTGLANWEYTEVLSGLNEGDRIVTALDKPGVKAGAKVQPELEPSAK